MCIFVRSGCIGCSNSLNLFLSVCLRALQFPPEGWLRIGLNNGSITWLTVRPSGRVALRTLGDSGFMPPDKLTRTWEMFHLQYSLVLSRRALDLGHRVNWMALDFILKCLESYFWCYFCNFNDILLCGVLWSTPVPSFANYSAKGEYTVWTVAVANHWTLKADQMTASAHSLWM